MRRPLTGMWKAWKGACEVKALGFWAESRESQGTGIRPGLHLIIDLTVRETWVKGIDRETDLERLGASFIEMERREGMAVGEGCRLVGSH